MKNQARYAAGYRIIKEHNLIIDLRSGLADLACLEAYKIEQTKDSEFNINFDILEDVTEMDLDLIINELEYYTNFMAGLQMLKSSGRKVAAIVKTPHQMVHAQALQKHLKDLQEFKFFTSLKPAIAWLDKPITEEEIIAITKEIKKNPSFSWK